MLPPLGGVEPELEPEPEEVPEDFLCFLFPVVEVVEEVSDEVGDPEADDVSLLVPLVAVSDDAVFLWRRLWVPEVVLLPDMLPCEPLIEPEPPDWLVWLLDAELPEPL